MTQVRQGVCVRFEPGGEHLHNLEGRSGSNATPFRPAPTIGYGPHHGALAAAARREPARIRLIWRIGAKLCGSSWPIASRRSFSASFQRDTVSDALMRSSKATL